MSQLKTLIIAISFLVLGAPASADNLANLNRQNFGTTKSFTEWKSEKLKLAEDQLSKARSMLAAQQSVSIRGVTSYSPAAVDLAKQITQLEFNLDVAQHLSVTDYLVLYLSSQSGSTKYKDAASRLSPEETAKIMEAYLKALQVEKEADRQNSLRSSNVDLFN